MSKFWTCQNLKMTESFQTGRCHNLNSSEFWKRQNLKMSESFQTGRCHNLNLSEFLKHQNLKMSESFQTGSCQNMNMSESFQSGKCQNIESIEYMLHPQLGSVYAWELFASHGLKRCPSGLMLPTRSNEIPNLTFQMSCSFQKFCKSNYY